MKILQVNVLASTGSTGKITTDIHNTLIESGCRSLVCYGAGTDAPSSKGYYRICSYTERHINTILRRLHGISYGRYAVLATRRLVKKIKTYKPDIVHLQCINGDIVDIYKLLSFLGDNRIKTVCTLHAEFMYTGTCGHAYDCLQFTTRCRKCPIYRRENHSIFDNTEKSWYLMNEAFSHFSKEDIIFTSVSPWLMSRALMSPIVNGYEHCVVMNGLDDSIFRLRPVPDIIKSRFDKNKKTVLFVSAFFDQKPESHKGGWYFVQLAKMLPQYQFCIVASVYSDCDNLPENIVFWGRANGQVELAALYNFADVSVVTSIKETFSMVTAESLCCGTPVVGFEAGGPESIAIPEFSSFVKYGDINNLRKTIEQVLEREYDAAKISEASIERYSRNTMTKNYIDVYKKLLKYNE